MMTLARRVGSLIVPAKRFIPRSFLVKLGQARGLFIWWSSRLRAHAAVNVSGVTIVFPVTSDSFSAFGRITGAHQKEPATQRWLLDIASESPGGTLWDVGANIGLFTLLAGKLGLNVVAFEPLPLSQQLLQRAIVMNGLNDVVVAIPLGLNDQTVVGPFFIRSPRAGISGSSFGTDLNGSQYYVQSFALAGDDLARILPDAFRWPTAIKVDVDGIEAQILGGLRETLARTSLRHVMVEELAQETHIGEILGQYGFVLNHEENTTPHRPGRHVNRYFERLD